MKIDRTYQTKGFVISVAGLLTLAAMASVIFASSAMAAPVVLINRLSGQCATNPGNGAAPTAQMVQRPCQDAPSGGWTIQPGAGGNRIVSQLDGFCLGVANGSQVDGAAVREQTCNGGARQRWTIEASDAHQRIVAKHSGKCLAVANASRASGAKLVQQTCNGASAQKWTVSEAPLRSAWGPKITFPLVPAAAANMSSGAIVVWSAYSRIDFRSSNNRNTYTAIFDPATLQVTEQLVTNLKHDMFCPGTALLPDGRLLVNGGRTSQRTSIFDPAGRAWSRSTDMNIPRGYQGTTLLSTGDVLTLGGSWSGGNAKKNGEIWSAGDGWRKLANLLIDPFLGTDPKPTSRDNHLWLEAWSDGWAFHAGPAAAMHWIDTAGEGRIVDAGPRGDDSYAINGNAVLYDVGKLLKVGGATAYNGAPSSDAAYMIDFGAGPSAAVAVRKLGPMLFPRAMHNSVVLPNGQVVIVGGLNPAKTFSDDAPVLMAEIWDPVTLQFSRLAAMATPRNYHSVALLMLDGRVFSAGGGLCGDCLVNHPDAEILTPPYLLNADGSPAARPSILSAPGSVSLGDSIRVRTDGPIASFALVRLASVTHSVNNDQRRIPLRIAGGDPNAGYDLPIPADPGVVLPGNYMLFALNAAGRPSVAKVVGIR